MDMNVERFLPHDVTLSPEMKLHYFHRNGRGIDLIFLHNSGGYGRIWEQTAAHLGSNFNIFALDQRGHGDSSRPDGDYSADEYARDLRAFVDKLELKKVVVVGVSLGGRVALAFAALYPEATRGLVLVGGPHKTNFYQSKEAVQTVLSNAHEMLLSPTAFSSREAALTYLTETLPPTSFWRLVAESNPNHRIDYNMTASPDGQLTVKYDPIRVAQGLTHMLTNLRPYAAKVRCPVTFIRAANSAMLTKEIAIDLSRFFTDTDVDIRTIDGKAILYMENPEGLANAICAFAEQRLSKS